MPLSKRKRLQWRSCTSATTRQECVQIWYAPIMDPKRSKKPCKITSIGTWISTMLIPWSRFAAHSATNSPSQDKPFIRFPLIGNERWNSKYFLFYDAVLQYLVSSKIPIISILMLSTESSNNFFLYKSDFKENFKN